ANQTGSGGDLRTTTLPGIKTPRSNPNHHGFLRQRLTNLPMVSERIDDPSDAPPMLITHWPDGSGSRGDCLCESFVRFVHDHHHPGGSPAKGFRAKILVLGRLVRYPKLGAVDREAGDHRAIRRIDTIQNVSVERG